MKHQCTNRLYTTSISLIECSACKQLIAETYPHKELEEADKNAKTPAD